jgi:thioredoxin-like negative regulator of GroEL
VDDVDPEVLRTRAHRLCVVSGVDLARPDDVPEAERLLRQVLADRPADSDTATLLAGLLLRQHRTKLETSVFHQWNGEPGDRRSVWLRALWARRAEALDLYRRVLDADPANAAAANGMAFALLDTPSTDDLSWFPCGVDDDEGEDLDEDDPALVAEVEERLRRVLAARPDDEVTAATLAEIAAIVS